MTQRQKIIIDGYNVIHTDDALRRRACKDLEAARGEFLRRLAEYVSGRHLQVTVVFDGRGSMVDAESVVRGKLQAIYSTEGQSADELIVSTLRESGNARAYIVVTSDMTDIGSNAKALGCEVIGSRRFLERLSASTSIAGDGPGSRPADEAERSGEFGSTDYWLKKFKDEKKSQGD